MNAPIPANAEKMEVIEMELPKEPSATICAVMVVPMLAPYMMDAARGKDMIPALTNPMTRTVVAPELWMAAVDTAPIPTPRILLLEAFENMALSLELLMDSRFELSILQDIRKTPIPAASIKRAVIIMVLSIISDSYIFGIQPSL